MTMPNIFPIEGVDGYQWKLPDGWSYNGDEGTVTSQSHFIDVVPSGNCDEGTVEVKAFFDYCGYRKYSDKSDIVIDRVVPPITTSPSFSGSYCGFETPITFRVCATRYDWSFSNTGWTNSGSWDNAGPSITLTPSGSPTDAGTLTVVTTFDCGSVSRNYTIVYNSATAPSNPTITKNSSNEEICTGEVWNITLNPPNGYTNNYGLEVYATGQLKINGQIYSSASPLTTTANSVNLSASAASSGASVLRARMNNPQCPASGWSTIYMQAGPYSSSQFSISGPTSVCSNTTQSYLSTLIDPDITNYQWTTSGVVYQSGQGTPYLGVYVPPLIRGGSVTLRFTNRCGTTGSPAFLFLIPGFCGFSYSISPNPSSNEMVIDFEPQEEESREDVFEYAGSQDVFVVVMDKSGSIRLKQRIETDRQSIDISNLEKSEYFVKVYIGEKEIDNTKRLIKD